jgi:hypothetical protein
VCFYFDAFFGKFAAPRKEMKPSTLRALHVGGHPETEVGSILGVKRPGDGFLALILRVP